MSQPRRISQKPVIALLGEFSAGKSTLTNLLICEGRSPVKVTATQLPPVWYSHGADAPYRVDLTGEVHPIDLDRIEAVSVDDTAYIRVFLETDVLELFDLIDMPGNSDPNMSPEVWQRTIHVAHGVIWCTHATQAWRQSEAATWEELPEVLRQHSLLLLTRFDKLLTEKDRKRVLHRVRGETRGMFRGVYPISLLEAMNSGDDREAWERSGADEFIRMLLDIVSELDLMLAGATPPPPPVADTIPLRRPDAPRPPQPSVAPKRVAAPAKSKSPRPPREGARRPVA